MQLFVAVFIQEFHVEKQTKFRPRFFLSHSGRKPFHFLSNVFCWTKTFFSLLFFSPQTNFPKRNKYPVLTLLMTILHNSRQDEMIPGRAGMVVVRRRQSTPSTAATGGGIAGGTTTTMTPASALASASASASALASASASASASALVSASASALASASASAPTAAGMMATARRPFDQEVEDGEAEPRVTTTSHVSRDDYQ